MKIANRHMNAGMKFAGLLNTVGKPGSLDIEVVLDVEEGFVSELDEDGFDALQGLLGSYVFHNRKDMSMILRRLGTAHAQTLALMEAERGLSNDRTTH